MTAPHRVIWHLKDSSLPGKTKNEAHNACVGFGSCASVGISECMLMCWTCGFVGLWICVCALNCEFSWLPSVERVLVHLGRHKNSIRQRTSWGILSVSDMFLLRECICWVVTHPTFFSSSHPSITQVCTRAHTHTHTLQIICLFQCCYHQVNPLWKWLFSYISQGSWVGPRALLHPLHPTVCMCVRVCMLSVNAVCQNVKCLAHATCRGNT